MYNGIEEGANIPELLKFKRNAPVKNASDFLKRREEIKAILEEHEYGHIPKKPLHLNAEIKSEDRGFCAGKAIYRKLSITVSFESEEFSFPVSEVTPKSDTPVPAFVFMNFRPDVPDKHLPSEEIADNGFAVFSFCYNDITADNGNFKNGIAKHFINKRRKASDPGKIAMWAWAAMRVMDYIVTLSYVDKNNVAVIGHSTLGKAALVAGGFDERFKYVISNDSGCSGAAISHGKIGENLAVITDVFPYWFCKKYAKYAGNENSLPFDQHFLIALSIPRHVMIGSAELDTRADPESEFKGLCLASEAYHLFGMKGLVHNGKTPLPKTVLDEGDALYQVRRGTHYLSREDWNEYIRFIKKKMQEKNDVR